MKKCNAIILALCINICYSMDGSRVEDSLECFEKHAAYEIVQKENDKIKSLNNRQNFNKIRNQDSINNLFMKMSDSLKRTTGMGIGEALANLKCGNNCCTDKKASVININKFDDIRILQMSPFLTENALRSEVYLKAERLIANYNDFLRKKDIYATINVSISINPKGFVDEALIVSSNSDYNEFDNKIISKIKQWRFREVDCGITKVNIWLNFFPEK